MINNKKIKTIKYKCLLLVNTIKSLYMKEIVNIVNDFKYICRELERDLLYIIDNILFIKRQICRKYDLNIMKYLYEIVLLFHLGLVTSILTNPSDLSITNHIILITLDPIDPLNSDYYDIPLSRITFLIILLLYLKYKS